MAFSEEFDEVLPVTVGDITIIEMAFHRNGVSGETFYSFRAEHAEHPEVRFVGSVFASQHYDNGWEAGEPDWGAYERGEHPNPWITVFDAAELADPEKRLDDNMWRGDHFAPAVYTALHERQQRAFARLHGLAEDSSSSDS